MTKMIPPVPTSAVMLPTPKQKIGFSIASIVGNDSGSNSATDAVGTHSTSNAASNVKDTSTTTTSNIPTSPPQTPPSFVMGATHLQGAHFNASAYLTPRAEQHALHQHLLLHHQHNQQQQKQPRLDAPMNLLSASSVNQANDIRDIIQRLHNSANAAVAAASLSAASYSLPASDRCTQPPTRRPSSPNLDAAPANVIHLKRERSPLPPSVELAQNPAQRHQPPQTPPKSVSPISSHPSSPPLLQAPSPTLPAQTYAKPLLMPGVASAGLVRPFPMGPGGPVPVPQHAVPDIKALPPYINAPPELPPQHNPHLLAAAQFQMAAALQAGHVLGPAGLPTHSPFMPNPNMPRDSYPLYPWLLSRHGRIFPHRFPGNFLLQPFRKPKRIRTAFSPSQLLKLEHAFESNQYVVGAERKALAQSLNLSETQVKVWFQNRRTKHKRMQQEDEKGTGSERNSQGASCDEEDDELIDMEMDDCLSDEEPDLDTSH